MNRSGQPGAGTICASPPVLRGRPARSGRPGKTPGVSLATRLFPVDNRLHDESRVSQGDGLRPVALVPATRGIRPVRLFLPPQAGRLMRPTGPTCKHVKTLLGVYVLGGLRGHQETRVTTHLARCARCRAEYEELAEVPALLDMITGEEAAEAGRLADVPGGGEERPAAQAGAASDGEPPCPLPLRRAPTLAEPG